MFMFMCEAGDVISAVRSSVFPRSLLCAAVLQIHDGPGRPLLYRLDIIVRERKSVCPSMVIQSFPRKTSGSWTSTIVIRVSEKRERVPFKCISLSLERERERERVVS